MGTLTLLNEVTAILVHSQFLWDRDLDRDLERERRAGCHRPVGVTVTVWQLQCREDLSGYLAFFPMCLVLAVGT